MAQQPPPEKLSKSLRLFDVYAISTGAMFSSGFFLLPGLATAQAGPSAVLAYLLAGVLVLPAMFSQAELATAMPKAGGTYYFLDRSLGPLAGTVGGIGTWLSLIFKSAFALIGMGAYLMLFFDVPIKPIAVGFTIAFTALNIFGAKETSGLQRFFVTILVAVLAFFVAQGLVEVFSPDGAAQRQGQFRPFAPFGLGGLISTIGLVFVSYAGLTKVASVAEEVENPDRNIPLGMFLSLATATVIYVVGVYIMVAMLEPTELRADLTPVATAGEAFFDWLPWEAFGQPLGVLLIVIAAIAAFASTGNAGILSASRYPLAMARDGLVARAFDRLGRFGTPTWGILATAALMVAIILFFDVAAVAKLASAFNLLIFGLLNVAVIVMRESRIPSYAPGYRSPLYPWMQIAGLLTAVFLIVEIGVLTLSLTLGVIAASVVWYFYYARGNPEVEREGAIYHLFERLGQHRYEGLEEELHGILEDKEISEDAPFDQLVARAPVIDLEEAASYEGVTRRAAELLAERLPISTESLAEQFLQNAPPERIPISHGAALPHYRIDGIEHAEMALVRCQSGLCIEFDTAHGHERTEPLYAMFFLVSPRDQPSRHLRVLANIASRVDEEQFMEEWRAAEDEQQLKEALLHYERHLSLYVKAGASTEAFIGTAVKDLNLPAGNLIALIRRNGKIVVPRGGAVVEEGDRLTVIGEPAGIKRVYELYRR